MDVNLPLPRLAVVPRALIIVEALGGRASIATALRDAARQAIATLFDGDGSGGDGRSSVAIITGSLSPSGQPLQGAKAEGSFGPYGVNCTVSGGTDLPELLGRWLIEDYLENQDTALNAVDCRCFESVSQALVAGYERLLVVVDGPFGLGESSPIGNKSAAYPADALCSRLAGQDCAEVDMGSAEFPAPGEYAGELWQQLADAQAGWKNDGVDVVKHVHYCGSPYGIGYHVASWRLVQNGLEEERARGN